FAEMTGQHARIKVVGAAHAVADIKLDVAALVEFRGGLRICRRLRERHRRKCEEQGGDAPSPSANTHRPNSSDVTRPTFGMALTPARTHSDRSSRNPFP